MSLNMRPTLATLRHREQFDESARLYRAATPRYARRVANQMIELGFFVPERGLRPG